MKFITLPVLSETEVARMVELRYREYLPMPRADIVYDFSVTRFSYSQEEADQEGDEAGSSVSLNPADDELRVTVMGLEKGAYLGFKEAFASQGVLIRSIETNQCALARGYNFLLGPEHSGTYAALYLNDTYSIVNFVVDHGLYYSRLLEHGLQSLTPDESGKRRVERLLRELYRSVDFFSVESRGIPIEALYIANGGISPDSGVTRRIQRFLGENLSVEVVSLKEVVEMDDRIVLPSGTVAGTLVLPIGLALRHSRTGIR
jgi:Tfp pilus assembly PilM family ATPase